MIRQKPYSSKYPYELHPSAMKLTKELSYTVDIQLVAQTIIYYTIMVFGSMVAIPIIITTNNFHGNCLLYADVANDRILFGNFATCTSVAYIHVTTCVIYGGIQASLYTYAVIKNLKGSEFTLIYHQAVNIIVLCINIVITLLSLICSCVISVGFSRWCNSLLLNASLHHGYHLQDCSKGEELDWQTINGSTFHSCYSLATAASWLSLFSWLVQTALNMLFYVQQKHELLQGSSSSLCSAESSASQPLSPADTSERF